MPWFIVAYLLLIVALGVCSFYDDRKAKLSIAYLTVDAVVTAVWMYFVVAYFYPPIADPVGRALPLLLVLSVVWTAADVRRELKGLIAQRPASYDPELSPRVNLLVDRAVEGAGLVVGMAVLAPALVYGILVIRRAW